MHHSQFRTKLQCYFRAYGDPQLSRQKQIVSPRKQIASRQKQTAYGKSKLEMAKTNKLRQKQIGNGKSKFVTAKANWKCNSQLVKVESKVVAAKANCTLRKCQTADKLRKSFRTKAKQQNGAKSVGESLLIEKAESLRQKQISYFTATYHVTKVNSFVAKAHHLRVAQKQQLVPRLPLDPFRRTGCKIARHCWILGRQNGVCTVR